ncbi:hypothetical protein LTR05_000624 [Lithohypha guttulata]|uniref:Rrn9 domain-containing protein n=1 Tax=Lithohypha guttulata TaxID=1690604 RepID=A0AAN7YE40_9EURO|nr:hypothetical protein LTR05_000624 [Lithohypha guttulata]
MNISEDIIPPTVDGSHARLTSSSPPSESQSQASPDNTVLADAEFEEYVKQYPFAAEPTYFTRPNRYYGSASTWRSWTAGDRAVTDVLDLERASDLGIHAYNAFALKQRARGNSPSRRSRSRSRSHQIAEQFAPTEVWTAWPMRGKHVPREDLPERKVPSLSAVLEEALIATTLRFANERWNSRNWAPENPEIKPEKRDWQVEQMSTQRQLHNAGLTGEDASKDETRTSDSTEGSDHDSLVDDTEPDDPLPGGIQTFSSQAFLENNSSSTSEEGQLIKSDDDEDDKAVFSVDEDQTRRLLLPSARHILSKIDDLLTGLHRSRASYANRQKDPKPRLYSSSRSAARDTDADTTDGERLGAFQDDRKRRRVSSRNRGRKRKRSPSSSEESADSSIQLRSSSRPRKSSGVRETGHERRAKGPGLRDWSDVVGMAALTGWDTVTVARASERCARLFGENMLWRTFHEKDTAPAEQVAEAGPWFGEEVAYANEDHAGLDNQGETEQDLPGISGYQPRQSQPLELAEITGLPIFGHMFEITSLRCPIATCPQSKFVYSRRTRLYQHIGYAHPDFDLASFKKIVGRNSKRGRYDRSQMRSRSRPRTQTEYQASQGEGHELQENYEQQDDYEAASPPI